MSAQLQIGNTVLHYKQTTSTNDLAKQLIQQHSVPNGSVVVAAFQTQGKGQQEKRWESEEGKNLLCTYILHELDIDFQYHIYFNMAISCALRKCIAFFIPQQNVQIKWPNDVYVNKRKIAGLLIENNIMGESWKHAFVGIGINVNQSNFNQEIATSLALLANNEFDINEVLQVASIQLMHYLSMLNEADKENIHAEYHAHLMHIDEMTRYLAHGQEKQGILRGIDKYGRVIMENNSQTETYQHGEIKLIVS